MNKYGTSADVKLVSAYHNLISADADEASAYHYLTSLDINELPSM